MYVRLATTWADQAGTVHCAGDCVDIDIVTLAQLEGCGVVENCEETGRRFSAGPDRTGTAAEPWR